MSKNSDRARNLHLFLTGEDQGRITPRDFANWYVRQCQIANVSRGWPEEVAARVAAQPFARNVGTVAIAVRTPSERA